MTSDPLRRHDHRSELRTDAGKAAYEAVREVVWYGVKDRFPGALDLVGFVGDRVLELESAALSTTPAPLDAAWAAAEAALPNGESHKGHHLWKYGDWRMRVVGPWDIEYNGHRPSWQAIAEPYNATGHGDNNEIEAIGPTPAAALLALAEKLRSTP